MATATVDPVTETPGRAPYRMSAEEYFRAIDADVFAPESRIELWDGQIYEKMAKKLPHAGAHGLVIFALTRTMPAGWCCWPEGPILVDDFTAPLPDVALVRGTPHVYTARNSVPHLGEIGLVVEVADSSLRKNLTTTMTTYARASLPVYWVVNLVDGRVEVYSEPQTVGELASYASSEIFRRGESVPLILDGQEVARIPVNDLVPETGETAK